MKSIQPWLFVIGIALNLLGIKIASVALPDKLYFSFSAFLFDNRDLLRAQALAAKLAIPFLISFAIASVIYKVARSQTEHIGKEGSIAQVIKNQLPLTLAFSAAAAALLMAWPYILLWDVLVDPVLAHQRLIFLLAYIAYFVGYGFFALSGAETALVVLTPRHPTSETDAAPTGFALSRLLESPLIKPLSDALSGGLIAAFAAFLATRGG